MKISVPKRGVSTLRSLADVVALVLAFEAAYLLRFDFSIPEGVAGPLLLQLPMVLLIQLLSMQLSGVYRLVWRYVSLADIEHFVRAFAGSMVPLVLLRFGLPDSLGELRVPLSVIVLDGILAFCATLSLRALRRIRYESRERNRIGDRSAKRERRPVLLVGAGSFGVLAAREIASRGDIDLDVRGFVDDDPEKLGTMIQGVKVLGTTRDIPQLVAELQIDHVVITVRRAAATEVRRVVDICEQTPVRVRIVPALYEVLEGAVEITRIRDVEIEDLLGRDTVELDQDRLRTLLGGRRVLITGAGGSIGAELCEQVLRFSPAALIAVDRSEFAIFECERRLQRLANETAAQTVVADISNEVQMRALLESTKPEIVLHAAAHKHVPMMERNVAEAVRNNILGTLDFGRLCGETGVGTFVLISTDKAVRPTSIMGATKRVAELVVQDLARVYGTRYMAVRFGNVLGSTGSVVSVFRSQIASGGPVTVTDPTVTRYFMTPSEAAQLVLEAATIGAGGEILVLDMGEPIRIVDLARDMIRLSGLRPYVDVDIVFTGLRPGEKLHEELELVGEAMRATRHPKVSVGLLTGLASEALDFGIRRLRELVREGREDSLRAFLGEFLPESQLQRSTGESARRSEERSSL